VRVLIAEDDLQLADAIVRGLRRRALAVDHAADGALALEMTHSIGYDVVVLDRDLPRMHGDVVCQTLSEGDAPPRILMLTARDGVSDRVTGLREGADDYLAKPFAMEELVARLQALLRRPGHLLGRLLSFGNVALDTEGRQVFVGGTARAFPARETAVLEILLRRGGNVAPKRLFEDQLFGLSGDVGSNAVEVYVHRLRKMLGDAGASVKIHTVRGVGYLMAEEKAG